MTTPFGSSDHEVRDAAQGIATPRERFPLTRRDLSLIVGFWLLYALLEIASHVFDPGPPGQRPGEMTLTSWAILAIAEAMLWALLTPVIVSLAGRVGSAGMTRATQLLLFVLLGVGIALGMSVFGHLLSEAVRAAPVGSPIRGPSRTNGDHSRGPPLWFGFMSALVIYLGVLAAGIARTYSRRLSERREQMIQLQAELAEARLDALRRQLDPRFLFNTLDAISTLVERDPRGVRRMITRLSELLRYSMEGGREPEILLRRELDMVDRYFDIMQVRFPGLLVMRLLDNCALDMMVPSMILQPLVENAIKHGVEKMTEPGRIEIETLLEGNTVVIRVRDNGPATGTLTDAPQEGVGLRDTVARLTLMYGAEGRFSLTRSDEGLTVAEVRIPARVNPGAHSARTE